MQGRIVNGAGEEIPDARIMLSHLSQEDAHEVGVSNALESFSLGAVEPGEIKITAKHYKTKGTDSVVLQLSLGSDKLRNPVMKQGLSIRGLLVDDTGMPVEGWRIIGRGPEGTRQPNVSRTDATGRCALSGPGS